jgi:hypothetical protein
MNPVFKKLNFKGQDKVYVLNAPREFQPHLEEMAEITTIKKSPNCKQSYEFMLFFVKDCAAIEKYAPKAAEKLIGDGILWFAYPKKSSRKYTSDVGRDDSWQALGDLGFEGVRQIAIDADWTALRFRRTEFIKTLTRDKSWVMSEKGKTRAD